MFGLLLNIFLPGTQPNELSVDLRPPSVCAPCHGAFGDEAPNDAWSGSMMANAARDPVFHAALTVARQDDPDAPDLCIRCHSPRAWLFGRSEPGEIGQLEEPDFESVQCDFCHRLVPGGDDGPRIGNGQYTVADDTVRRGPLPDPFAPHETELSLYHEDSALCGLCHDVSNPLRDGLPIERTYSEWAASAFAEEGTTCQTCHLPTTSGHACGARDAPPRDVHLHELAGGNAWIPLVLAGEHPELGRDAAYLRTHEAALRQLESAAALTVRLPEVATAGDTLSFHVRVENLTGHKLPTGYPEGRRMWLEVEARDAAGRVLLRSGAYDAGEGRLVRDALLRTYEVRMAADGVEGFHFILQDEILEDGRIPPRGFVAAPDTAPIGRTYPALADGTLANWDDAPYELALGDDVEGPVVVTARLWYQTTSREYVEFLRDQNRSDDAGQRLADLWNRYGRSAPVEMARAESTLNVARREPVARGGGCNVARGGGGAGVALLLAFLSGLGRRGHPTRRTSRCAG